MIIDNHIIDEKCAAVISDAVENPYEYSGGEADNTRLITLGYIRGALDMADCLKEVLKA